MILEDPTVHRRQTLVAGLILLVLLVVVAAL
jgi:hypothetical protein